MLEPTERQSRKFKDGQYYNSVCDVRDYHLLPFHFHRINTEKEVLVNEVGDFLIVPTGTASRIINRSLSKESDELLYADLIAGFFISEQAVPPLLDVIAARYRTRKSFLDYFTALHIFVITLRCEHTCHYCQVSRVTENKHAFDMQRLHIDAGIDLMMRSPNPHVTMEFQGGEALLAFDNIMYAVERTKQEAERHNKQVSFVICTNLAPLTDEMVSYCRENRMLISTSIDGPDYVHNQNRHRPEKNSYQVAVQGIKKCREMLGTDRVSALLTTTNLSLRFPHEIVDEYYNLGFRSIFLRPISPYGFATHNHKKITTTLSCF